LFFQDLDFGTAVANPLRAGTEAAMDDIGDTTTVGIRSCYVCGKGLLDLDRYCRWCSARQIEPTLKVASGAIDLLDSKSGFDTSPLSEPKSDSDAHRPISGPLVKLLVEGVKGKQSLALSERATRIVISALIAFPIWMIIVLLSPLDAWFVAKTVSSRA
jgi:hypothetical protein